MHIAETVSDAQQQSFIKEPWQGEHSLQNIVHVLPVTGCKNWQTPPPELTYYGGKCQCTGAAGYETQNIETLIFGLREAHVTSHCMNPLYTEESAIPRLHSFFKVLPCAFL